MLLLGEMYPVLNKVEKKGCPKRGECAEGALLALEFTVPAGFRGHNQNRCVSESVKGRRSMLRGPLYERFTLL